MMLKKYFGFDAFRPLQREIIEHTLRGGDTLAVMPTGGGKSLCYQLPALVRDGLTIVVSPLISLMKDQVEQLHGRGIEAVYLNSTLSRKAYADNIRHIRNGSVKLLYVAPETLLLPSILSLLASVPVRCLTIDEAHCISEWGHDFRPEYRQIAHVRQRFPGVCCLALTATATPRVQKDIRSNLGFRESDTFIAGFDRKNLYLQVSPKTDPLGQILDCIRLHRDGSGIIYCFSRKQVEELTAVLDDLGLAVRPYHAGLSPEVRDRNQELFINDSIRIMVATIAFGMGIDKANVRFVIHHDLPKNIESYYQQIGRAGRDGLPARCLLLFSHRDRGKIDYFISKMDQREQRIARAHLRKLVSFAETTACRRIPLLAYFGEKADFSRCGMCDNCRDRDHGRNRASRRRSGNPGPTAPLSVQVTRLTYDEELFEILRSKRTQLADRHGVPPYLIFPDRSLIEMSAFQPRTKSDMIEIHGVGRYRMRRYGSLFLDLIDTYCRNTGRCRASVQIHRPGRKPRYISMGELFNEGVPVPELMRRYRVERRTLLASLYEFILNGDTLRSDRLAALSTLSGREQRRVFRMFDTCGTSHLKPVYEALDRSVPYAELHVQRLCYLCRDSAA
ncbi:ATP-dependent DNA helicase RecQ [bacterium]|nr:ATP-dependent DNA helicase RecQ [bacterium]